MFASFQKKYFLSDKGVAGVKRGIFWTTLTNLVTMAGMGFLFLVMAGFVGILKHGADPAGCTANCGRSRYLLFALAGSRYYTYCIFTRSAASSVWRLRERFLRKLPLSFFIVVIWPI